MKNVWLRHLAAIFAVAFLLTAMPLTASAADRVSIAPADSSMDAGSITAKTESPILAEKEEWREESVKYFRCEDGTIIAAIYDHPVHYLDGKEWKEIDNTLVAAQAKNGVSYYKNTANGFQVNLPGELRSTAPASVTKGEHTLEWHLLDSAVSAAVVKEETAAVNAVRSIGTADLTGTVNQAVKVSNESKMTVTNQAGSLSYAQVFSGTELRYDVKGSTVKESLILAKVPTQTAYSFQITAKGLRAELQADRSVYFYAPEQEEPVFAIASPYMFDAAGEYSKDIAVSIQTVTDGYRYTITPSREWLLDDARVYPVTVDPTIDIGTDRDELEVTRTYSRYPTTTYGNADVMYAGSVLINGETVEEYRTFVKLPLPGLYELYQQHEDIEGHFRVVSGKLHMENYTVHNTHANNTQINMHQVTSNWSENTLTWNTMPSFNSTIEDYVLADSGSGTCIFDITALADGWMNGLYNNYGVMFKINAVNTKQAENVSWYSDDLSEDNANKRPLAEIHFRECKGLEDYWTYTSMSIGRGTTAAVNHSTGALTIVAPVSGVDGNLMPVSISSVYNINNTDAPYSGVWRTNYDMTITLYSEGDPDIEGDESYRFVDGDGTPHYFVPDPNNNNYYPQFIDEDGLGLILKMSQDDPEARYTITDQSKSQMMFNQAGYLVEMRDANENAITITPPGNTIRTITDGAGRAYTLTYSSFGNSLRLSKIVDPLGKSTTYQHSNLNGQLIGITYPDGKTMSFLYNNYGLYRINIDGQEIQLTYETPSVVPVAQQPRVAEMTYAATTTYDTMVSEKYTFDYAHNATTVTDVALDGTTDYDIPVTYQFNEYLQTVCVVSHNDGSSQSYKYGKPGGLDGQENKILLASDTQQSVINQLNNFRLDNNISLYSTKIATGQPVTITWDGTKGHTANGSIKIDRTALTDSSDGTAFAYQEYTVPTTGYYSFSAFANTGGTTFNSLQGASVRMERWRDGSQVGSAAQDGITQTAVSEWQRVGTTRYLEAGDTLRMLVGTTGTPTVGTMWFDDLQLELLTETVNSYNLLENSSFWNSTASWSKTGTWTVTTDSGALKPPEADKVVKVTGSATASRRLSQTIPVTNGKKGDTFSLGAWAKGNSAYLDPASEEKDDRAFGISLEFYNGSESVGYQRISFNRLYGNWQFISGAAIAPAAYTKVVFSLEYSQNVNAALFALPYLYKDNYGQSYTYDKNGNVTAATDQSQTQTGYSYNDKQLSALAFPAENRQFMTYSDTTNNLLTVQTTNGQRYEYTYDEYGNATGVIVGTNVFATTVQTSKNYYIRNAYSGNVLSANALAGGELIANYEYVGNTATQSFRLFSASDVGTDSYQIALAENTNLRLFNSNADGQSFWVDYDQFDENTSPSTFTFQRNANGTFTILTNASGNTMCIDGQPEDEINTENGSPIQQKAVVADDPGQQWYLIEVKNDLTQGAHYTASATYTDDGNYPSTVTDPLGNTTTYTYSNLRGRLTDVMDAKGNNTHYFFDEYNQKVVGVHTGGTIVGGSVSYTYDTRDNLKSILTGTGQKYSFQIDPLDRIASTWVGEAVGGRPLAYYTYEAKQGLLSKLTYGNGAFVNYSYDTLGRQTKVWYNNNTNTGSETVYNDRGLVGLLKDYSSNTRTRYEYDLAGRLVRVQKKQEAANDSFMGPLVSLQYRYEDGTSRLLETKVNSIYGSATTGYTYGDMTQGQMPDSVYTVSTDGTPQIQYTYDALGRLITRRLSVPGLDTHYGYQFSPSGGTSTQVRMMAVGGVTTCYSYDAVGNILTEGFNETTPNITYSYDVLNRLTQANYGVMAYNYTYDNNGNILTAVENGTTNTYTYGDSTWKDLLTAYNGQAITYDAIGNPLTYYNGSTMTWQNGRQLSSMTVGEKSAIFAYNADGTRHIKSFGGLGGSVFTYYYYVDGVLYAQTTDHANPLFFLYDDKGTPYGLRYGGNTYYYAYNLQGDVIGIYNTAGTKVASYVYDPWGKLLSLSDTSTDGIGTINPIRYRGYYYDAETGLYYCNSRYYDPETGRFINADGNTGSVSSDTQSYNMFSYCRNNPVNQSVGAAVSAASSVTATSAAPQNFYLMDYAPADIYIKYDVPHYYQGEYSLCWAFCQVMVEDFRAGVNRSNDDATIQAIKIAVSKFGYFEWNSGSRPDTIVSGDPVQFNTLYDLYETIQEKGPLYVSYGNYVNGKREKGHGVILVGVNLTDGTVYTNNPNNFFGEKRAQTLDEFRKCFTTIGSKKGWQLDNCFYFSYNFS